MNPVELQIKAALLREDRMAVVNTALEALALPRLNDEQVDCLMSADQTAEAFDMLMDMVSRLGISLPAVTPESFVENAIARAKAEILQDELFGSINGPVLRFSDLHNWVDANCYGGMCEEMFAEVGNHLFPRTKSEDDEVMFSQALIGACNRIQDALDAWISCSDEFAAALKAGVEDTEGAEA